MLVFELTPAGDVLEIHLDREGLEILESQLEWLRKGETHVHLKTKAWAGEELSDELQGEGDHLVNHVKIMRWGE